VRRENRGSNLGVKLALLILTTQPLEQVHQVLIPEVIVEVGRHMPHAPPVSDIWPYQRMTVGRFLKLSDCGQQASMSVRTLLHLGAASIIFLRNLLDWFYKLQLVELRLILGRNKSLIEFLKLWYFLVMWASISTTSKLIRVINTRFSFIVGEEVAQSGAQ
jgi:hypothetical protein